MYLIQAQNRASGLDTVILPSKLGNVMLELVLKDQEKQGNDNFGAKLYVEMLFTVSADN